MPDSFDDTTLRPGGVPAAQADIRRSLAKHGIYPSENEQVLAGSIQFHNGRRTGGWYEVRNEQGLKVRHAVTPA